MLNSSWINGAPVNSSTLGSVVQFEFSVSATATAATAILLRQRGLAVATITVAVTTQADLARVKPLATSRQVAVTAEASQTASRAMLPAEANVFVSAVLGASTPRALASSVNVIVTATLLPFDVFFDAAATAAVTAATLPMLRIRHFAVSGPVASATSSSLTMTPGRGWNAAANVTVSAIGEPDRTVGGVRIAEFSSSVSIAVTQQAEASPIANMSANVSATVTAAPVSHLSVNRIRRLVPGSHLARADAASVAMLVCKLFAASVSCVATAQADVSILKNLGGVAAVSVASTPTMPRLIPAAMIPATALSQVTSEPPALRRQAGMQSGVFALVTAEVGPLENVGVPMDPAPVSISVAANLPALIALRTLSFNASVGVSAAGLLLLTNFYDDEPDYRTDQVTAEDFVDEVEPEDFTFHIRDDSLAMKTFTKQPNDRLAYDIVFSEWFADLEGDDIEYAYIDVVSATSGDQYLLIADQPLLIDSPSTKAKVWVEGGAHGVTYQLTITIETEGGRRKERDFKIKVKEI